MNDRRPWYSLHARTWFALVAVAIALLTFNVRGSGEPIKCTKSADPTSRGLLGDYNPRFLGADSPSRFPLGREFRYWSFGWPCTYVLQHRYTWNLESDLEYFKFARVFTFVQAPQERNSIYELRRSFSRSAMLINVAVALLILAGTTAALEHRLVDARPGQFSLRTLLLLPVILAVMAAGVYLDPTFLSIPGILAWPLWGFLWFGVGCTLYAAGLLIVRLARHLQSGRKPRSATPAR